ncbi:hypothetical protein AAC03nite_34230 [Alicyclobacillus acidoterrestris]|uniref:energy-coupling factor ABC transporter ATP-binding protein n=1 Tax=Alicyclobacillus suci TaxID=2816080 RepID=UPI0011949E83|nr:energy-coupling factor ABC transporter ATP-binding protein [Alicyclobacillus suci]GEO27638.1 hypothetical protein AAC03nite_34230 [Alicyclobacillus acidoterrestris]
MAQPRIILDNVCVARVGRADRPLPVLNHVSLAFGKREIVALVGHNGAGKTTLARTILGLYPLTEGCITYEGTPIRELSPGKIQMVFQPPSAQLIGQTIFEELALTALQRNSAITRAQLDVFVQHYADMVQLTVPIETSVYELSGGQLQRLCIAQALASGAKVLLFDESFAPLDDEARTALRKQLRTLAERHALTIVLITHDMEDVLIADRVVILDAGEVRLATDPQTFFYGEHGQTPRCATWGFRPPYIVDAALAANHRFGLSMRPLSEEELVEELLHVYALSH